MSAPDFTPGPWSCWIDSYEDNPFPGKDYVSVFMGEDDVSGVTSPANAHLIAAAPELFEALLRMSNEVRLCGYADESGFEVWLTIADAALAKAQGASA
jgi:hypothetical protein